VQDRNIVTQRLSCGVSAIVIPFTNVITYLLKIRYAAILLTYIFDVSTDK